jgi:hypothetical protein
MSTTWWVSLIVPSVLAVVWLIRLEGRIYVQDERHKSLEKRFEGLESQIIARLDRIEEKLDRKVDR